MGRCWPNLQWGVAFWSRPGAGASAAAWPGLTQSHVHHIAVGAFLEFSHVTPEGVEQALTLPGGGCWDVGPGQVRSAAAVYLLPAHRQSIRHTNSVMPAGRHAAVFRAVPCVAIALVSRLQFTDDTELALCLAHSLEGHPPSAGFPAGSVAREYAWCACE